MTHRKNRISTLDRDRVEASVHRILLNRVASKRLCPSALRRSIFRIARIDVKGAQLEAGFHFANLNVEIRPGAIIGTGTQFRGIGKIIVRSGTDARDCIMTTEGWPTLVQYPLTYPSDGIRSG